MILKLAPGLCIKESRIEGRGCFSPLELSSIIKLFKLRRRDGTPLGYAESWINVISWSLLVNGALLEFLWVKKTFLNTKGQRIKGTKREKGKPRCSTTTDLDPVHLCPLVLRLLTH